MSKYDFALFVVEDESGEHEVEVDLSEVPEAGHAITMGKAVLDMLDGMPNDGATVTVRRYAQ